MNLRQYPGFVAIWIIRDQFSGFGVSNEVTPKRSVLLAESIGPKHRQPSREFLAVTPWSSDSRRNFLILGIITILLDSCPYNRLSVAFW